MTALQDVIKTIEYALAMTISDDDVNYWMEKEKEQLLNAYHEGKRNAGVHTVNESETYYESIKK